MHCLQKRSVLSEQNTKYERTKWELPLPVSQIDHTLDVEAYCQDRFARSILQRLNEDDVYFHLGSASEALAFHAEEGWTEVYEVFTKAVKKLRSSFILSNPNNNQIRFVVCNLYGQDTLSNSR